MCWRTGTRTPIDGTKNHSPTIRRSAKYLIVSRAQPKAERVYDTTKYLSSKAILVAFLDLVDTTLERRIKVNTVRVGKAG